MAAAGKTVINRGTGAGGAKTNVTGLAFEDNTCLTKMYDCEDEVRFGKSKNDTYKSIRISDEIKLRRLIKNGLNTYMRKYHSDNIRDDYCKKFYQPDEALIDSDKKIIWIFEKKYQRVTGSVDEKLETGAAKRWHYSEEQFKGFSIRYAYILNDWFKQECYKHKLKWNKMWNIPVFWGEDIDYKASITKWIETDYA